MDLKGIMLCEISHMEKDKYCVVSLICGIETKQINKTSKSRLTDIENKLIFTNGDREVGRGNHRGRGLNRCQLLGIK